MLLALRHQFNVQEKDFDRDDAVCRNFVLVVIIVVVAAAFSGISSFCMLFTSQPSEGEGKESDDW